MNRKSFYIGKTKLNLDPEIVSREFVDIQGERFLKIGNYNMMPDFFMNIVSNSNHWMFISSNGSLSAGRIDRDNALFPYYTEDKIHDHHNITGSKTIIIVHKFNKNLLWEPFVKGHEQYYNIERNLYKSIYGNKIIFEEINYDLHLSFRYGWYNSDKFGFIKKSELRYFHNHKISVEVLDGIRNILPYGVGYNFQNNLSNLLDAYKKNELLKDSGLGVYSLSSIPVDRAEPSESLKATTVWSHGLKDHKVLISDKQLESFRKGLPIETENDIRAFRGAYYVNVQLEIDKDTPQEWMLVAELQQGSSKVANLNEFLLKEKNIEEAVNAAIKEGTDNLVKIVAGPDGMQHGNEELHTARHFSNTLYNVMRGGTYLNNYQISTADFINYVRVLNKKTFAENELVLNDLPLEISKNELIEIAENIGNKDLLRISQEYLPVTFSRRHGDPSRPWNQFSIKVKNEDGTVQYDYQGNWRDIFQNWEALSYSYPEYVENTISKFLNASTADGYNPYRIMRNGVDWECPDPEDPWAYIGYWGDHQIIYLLRLLEVSDKFHPGKLDEFLTKDLFAFANVPYRIKPYKDILENPQDTIVFDHQLNEQITSLVNTLGTDGKLLLTTNQKVYHVNLTEKILITLLTKLCNFVPGAGIWLNTQRPEWNDANNALVGNGASMVTLYYLRRFLKFWQNKLHKTLVKETSISEEVLELFLQVHKTLVEYEYILEKGFSDEGRKFFVDNLGKIASSYRLKIYKKSFSGIKKSIKTKTFTSFLELAIKYIDNTININKRNDGLYHSYNLLSFTEKGISVQYLYEMLEGQVAVLSSGSLTTQESLDVLGSLKNSTLFRKDQYSYILYPDKNLPRFNEKNNIPAEDFNNSALIKKLTFDKNTSIITLDNSGKCHFNGALRNAEMLGNAIDELDAGKYGNLVKKEKENILGVYEKLFNHKFFTGRSGTFFAYEGLGSIYWHMVSKLLLSTQECLFDALDSKAEPDLINKLKGHYNDIKKGIGVNKPPDLYGAFPTDPYSHTPAHAGVKQPGMTGQVKEDIISRLGELGVWIKQGKLQFNPYLFDCNEILKKASIFEYYSIDGNKRKIALNENQFAFTFCQIPIIYTNSESKLIKIKFINGNTEEIKGNAIDQPLSNQIFSRSVEIELIEVSLVLNNGQ